MTLQIDGAPVHVEQGGEGEPLLLLHGWGASVKYWRPNRAALEARYRVIAIDWPGFGRSPRGDAPCTVEGYAALVGRVMDALGIESAHLLGHSMGGAAALLFALGHPHRVRKIVTVNAPVDGASAFYRLTRLALLPVVRWFVFLLAKVGWIRRLACRRFTQVVPIDPEIVDDVAACTYGAVMRSALSLRRLALGPRLSAIRAPVLAVTSDTDRIIRQPPQVEHLRTIPGVTVRSFAAGHCTSFERPEEFNRAALEFLAHNGRA